MYLMILRNCERSCIWSGMWLSFTFRAGRRDIRSKNNDKREIKVANKKE